MSGKAGHANQKQSDPPQEDLPREDGGIPLEWLTARLDIDMSTFQQKTVIADGVFILVFAECIGMLMTVKNKLAADAGNAENGDTLDFDSKVIHEGKTEREAVEKTTSVSELEAFETKWNSYLDTIREMIKLCNERKETFHYIPAFCKVYSAILSELDFLLKHYIMLDTEIYDRREELGDTESNLYVRLQGGEGCRSARC